MKALIKKITLFAFVTTLCSFTKNDKEYFTVVTQDTDIVVEVSKPKNNEVYKWIITEHSPNGRTTIYDDIDGGNSKFRWFPGEGTNKICLKIYNTKTKKYTNHCKILRVVSSIEDFSFEKEIIPRIDGDFTYSMN